MKNTYQKNVSRHFSNIECFQCYYSKIAYYTVLFSDLISQSCVIYFFKNAFYNIKQKNWFFM